MADGFGAYTDHFGILEIAVGEEDTLADFLEITASTKTPASMSRTDAQDESEDIVASTWHGNTEGDLYDVSSTFVCKSGSTPADVLNCGELSAGMVVDSIQITTSNSAWPTITVSGRLGTKSIVAPSGFLNTWLMPAVTIVGAKRAQLLDFTIDAGSRLTGSSLSGSLSIAQQDDGLGEPAAHGISGGVLTQTAELVRVTAAPAWTPGGTWTETQTAGEDEGQASYHTGSGSAEKIWTRSATGL